MTGDKWAEQQERAEQPGREPTALSGEQGLDICDLCGAMIRAQDQFTCPECGGWGNDKTCHCGRPVAYGYDGNPEHHRGMCQRCDAVRCDVDPEACRHDPVDRPTLTDEQLAGFARLAADARHFGNDHERGLASAVEHLIAALTAEREAHASEVERLEREAAVNGEQSDRNYRIAERERARAEQAERQVRAIESEIGHAEQNGHHLDPGCQGVEPGQRVPAVRIDRIRAALSGVSGPTTEGANDDRPEPSSPHTAW